jgi:tRNA threonylcarbamoyladenosine biosynthesis protein TsaB
MYTFAFDTTGRFCSLILLKDRQILSRAEIETDFGQAELLMTQTKKILSDNALCMVDMNLVAVCTGPGSFTGVRASVSAARAYALACPGTTVCGISAFEAYLAELQESQLADINAVLIETKREDFYVQYFDRERRKISEPATAFEADIVRTLSGAKVSMIGDGVERFLGKSRGLSLHTVEFSTGVSVEALAQTALKKYDDKTTDFPKPLYLKAPDVCVK